MRKTKVEQSEVASLQAQVERMREQLVQAQSSINEYGRALANAGERIKSLEVDKTQLTHQQHLLFQSLMDSHKLRMQERGQAAQLGELASLGRAVMNGATVLMHVAGAAEDETQG